MMGKTPWRADSGRVRERLALTPALSRSPESFRGPRGRRLRPTARGLILRMVASFIIMSPSFVLKSLAEEPVVQSKIPAPQLERVRKLLRESPLIDGHNDTPWQYRKHSNDFSAVDLTGDTSGLDPPMVTDIPRLRAGGIGGQFWSVFVPSTMGGSGQGVVRADRGGAPDGGALSRDLRVGPHRGRYSADSERPEAPWPNRIHVPARTILLTKQCLPAAAQIKQLKIHFPATSLIIGNPSGGFLSRL